MSEKIIIALDVSSREDALRLVKETREGAGMFKIGSQLYMAVGPAIVREIVEIGCKVFLDLKFHDIPNTVSRAAIEAGRLGVSMMTVHTAGGRAMMASTIDELRNKFGPKRPLVVGVTVLTSLDTKALFEMGHEQPIEDQVQRLAVLALESNLDGVVCSPREIALVRAVTNTSFKIVTPGIRMPDHSLNDQQRTATPRDAITTGANYIVVGRSVTDDPNPRAALDRIIQSL